MKKICELVLYVLIALLIFCLIGCAKETPVSEGIAENAINGVTAVEKTLTDECKTEAVKTQLTVIKSEIRSITTACQAEKDVITSEKLKWKWSFWGLVLVIGAYMAKKILK